MHIPLHAENIVFQRGRELKKKGLSEENSPEFALGDLGGIYSKLPEIADYIFTFKSIVCGTGYDKTMFD